MGWRVSKALEFDGCTARLGTQRVKRMTASGFSRLHLWLDKAALLVRQTIAVGLGHWILNRIPLAGVEDIGAN